MEKIIYINEKETHYSINEEGEVKNIITGKILKQHDTKDFYKSVMIYLDGKGKNCRVHRLLAQAFIPNPENKPYVNHKDGNRSNNKLENLEWCTPSENIRHAINTGLMTPVKERAVVQYDLDGNKIKIYDSITQAARETNSSIEKIILCCKHQRLTHNYFQWRYINEAQEKIAPQQKPKTEAKRIAQIDPISGEIIKIYNSITEAAKEVKGSSGAICNIINKKKNLHTHKGYKWELVDEIVQ